MINKFHSNKKILNYDEKNNRALRQNKSTDKDFYLYKDKHVDFNEKMEKALNASDITNITGRGPLISKRNDYKNFTYLSTTFNNPIIPSYLTLFDTKNKENNNIRKKDNFDNDISNVNLLTETIIFNSYVGPLTPHKGTDHSLSLPNNVKNTNIINRDKQDFTNKEMIYNSWEYGGNRINGFISGDHGKDSRCKGLILASSENEYFI